MCIAAVDNVKRDRDNSEVLFEERKLGILAVERRLSLLNGEQPPFAGHTLQRMRASIDELEPRAGD